MKLISYLHNFNISFFYFHNYIEFFKLIKYSSFNYLFQNLIVYFMKFDFGLEI